MDRAGESGRLSNDQTPCDLDEGRRHKRLTPDPVMIYRARTQGGIDGEKNVLQFPKIAQTSLAIQSCSYLSTLAKIRVSGCSWDLCTLDLQKLDSVLEKDVGIRYSV